MSETYVAGCAICQQNKMNTYLTMPPLTLIRSSGTRLFAIITMDFITDLPVSNEKDSLFGDFAQLLTQVSLKTFTYYCLAANTLTGKIE